MRITVNGTTDDLVEKVTIKQFLESRTLGEDLVIVVVNGEVTRREAWGEIWINPGDNVEIVRIVGGG
jgi:thiamine biosynthesis protein ThiS